MMREQDHNRKSELLLQAIGELPDEMIAQAAPQNLPLTKHRGTKLLRPQMFPAAAMIGIKIMVIQTQQIHQNMHIPTHLQIQTIIMLPGLLQTRWRTIRTP